VTVAMPPARRAQHEAMAEMPDWTVAAAADASHSWAGRAEDADGSVEHGSGNGGHAEEAGRAKEAGGATKTGGAEEAAGAAGTDGHRALRAGGAMGEAMRRLGALPAAAAEEALPAVTVTIGRIEVRPAAGAGRGRPVPRSPRLSLADYLRGRRGR
jgi:hypothetical protein